MLPLGYARAPGRSTTLLCGAIAIILAAALSAISQQPTRPVAAAASAGALSTDDGRIVDPRGRPVLLRGFNLIPVWTDRPGQTWDARHYRAIRARGLNVVRFPLYWSDLEPSPGAFDRRHLETLDTAIARARAAGLYVVLDFVHLYKGDGVPGWAREGDNVTSIESNAGAYVRGLARRYAEDDAVAAYDLVNEPDPWPIDADRSLRMYAGLIRETRQVAPEKIVMVEPPFGDSDLRATDFDILGDRRNVALTLHYYYAGGDRYGYAPDGQQVGRYTWDGDTGYEADDPAALERHLEVNVEAARAAGLPVWIGEFGISPEAPGAERWIEDMVALFERRGLGHAWWLYDSKSSFSALTEDGRLKPFVDALS